MLIDQNDWSLCCGVDAGSRTATDETHGVCRVGTVSRMVNSVYNACELTIRIDQIPTRADFAQASLGFSSLAGAPEPLGVCAVIDGHKKRTKWPTDTGRRDAYHAYGSSMSASCLKQSVPSEGGDSPVDPSAQAAAPLYKRRSTSCTPPRIHTRHWRLRLDLEQFMTRFSHARANWPALCLQRPLRVGH